MENMNNNFNMPPIKIGQGTEGEQKKKRFAGFLFGKGVSGPLARLLASKLGVVGLALGVTALASVAGIMIAKQDPSSGLDGMGAGTRGSRVASRASKYYTPSGARSLNLSSLPLVSGDPVYTDEVSKAVEDPVAAQDAEEIAPAMPEIPAIPDADSIAKAAKFSSASLPSGGGGSSPVVSNFKNTVASGKAGAGGGSALADSFRSAKGGAGVRSVGLGRGATGRAAKSGSSARGAHSGQSLKGFSSTPNTELAGKLERRKADSGTTFGEGVSASGEQAGAGGADSETKAFSAELPESDEEGDTSSGGGGSTLGGVEGNCADMAAKMSTEGDILKSNISAMSQLVNPGSTSSTDYDKFCEVTGNAMDEAVANVNGALNRMVAYNQALFEKGCQDQDETDGWQCGVMYPIHKKVSAFLTQANELCQYYYTYSARKQEGDNKNDTTAYLQQVTNEDAFNRKKDSEEYKDAVTDIVNLDAQVNASSDSDGANAGIAAMKNNHLADTADAGDTCEYDDQLDFTGDTDTKSCIADAEFCKSYATEVAGKWKQIVGGISLGVGLTGLVVLGLLVSNPAGWMILAAIAVTLAGCALLGAFSEAYDPAYKECMNCTGGYINDSSSQQNAVQVSLPDKEVMNRRMYCQLTREMMDTADEVARQG